MMCNCPKCSAELEVDLSAMPAEGSFNKCASCNTNFVVRKESFAKRALYKGTDIACGECGNPPGSSIYCQSCHAIYPDLLVIETSSAAKKQLGKILSSLNVLKNLKINIPTKAHHEAAKHTAPAGKGKGIKLPGMGQPAQLATVLAVILVMLIGGGYYWYQNKVATAYSQQYVRALFGLKTARDAEVAIGNRVAASWKAGASYTLTGTELKSASSAKSDVDTLLKAKWNVPGKFKASNDALTKLYESYGKLHAAVSSTTGTSEIYAGAVKKADDEFMRNAREIKAGLPEKLAEQLSESKKKYKVLQDF